MHSPNFSFSFILEFDACEYGIGSVLAQEYDNHTYVIAYASRTLSAAELNYSSVEREALAIVWATKHFRQYLEGGPVIVRSDCKALEWLKTARDPTGRLARWTMKLSPYHLIIQHRPGRSNLNGDFLFLAILCLKQPPTQLKLILLTQHLIFWKVQIFLAISEWNNTKIHV